MSDVVKDQVSVDFDTTQDALDRAKVPGKPISKDLISVSDDIWLGDTSVVAEHNDPLPKRFEGEEGITLMTDGPVAFEELTNQVHFLTGISTQVEDSVKDEIKDIAISYTGPLSGLLNVLSLKLNVNWSYEDGKIVFYKFKTRTFVLHTLATETTFSANVTSGSDGATSMQMTSNLKEWSEIGEVLKSIVKDGDVQLSPSTNSITVTSTPKTLQRVEAYVKELNRRFAKQVAVTVKVLQVSLNKSNNFGLNLTALFNNSFRVSSSSSNSATGGVAFSILSGSTEKMAGSEAVLHAISTQGRTSLVTSAVVTARNNRIVPINNVQTFKYISSISTLTENTNSTTEVTPAEETVGFSMQIMPNILENGKLILLFSMSLKELIRMDTATVSSGSSTTSSGTSTGGGGTVVQLPVIEQRNFVQELVMESGQTAVLTGFEKVTNTNDSEGLGPYEFTTIGGSQATTTTRDVLVVMLTPQIIASPLDTEDNSNNEWGMPSY
jgi:hypothetical protein